MHSGKTMEESPSYRAKRQNYRLCQKSTRCRDKDNGGKGGD